MYGENKDIVVLCGEARDLIVCVVKIEIIRCVL